MVRLKIFFILSMLYGNAFAFEGKEIFSGYRVNGPQESQANFYSIRKLKIFKDQQKAARFMVEVWSKAKGYRRAFIENPRKHYLKQRGFKYVLLSFGIQIWKSKTGKYFVGFGMQRRDDYFAPFHGKEISPDIKEVFNKAPGLYRDLLGTSEIHSRAWQFTLSNPGSDWQSPAFKPGNNWKRGYAGFGTKGTPGSIVKTKWNSRKIYLRKSFYLPKLSRKELNNLKLRIHHDDSAKVYINGVLAAELRGYTTRYNHFGISNAAIRALKLGGRKNTIAISCKQKFGGQFIDAGITTLADTSH